MKKILKSRIFSFILGLIVMASIVGVYAISANEITYNNTTVDDALNDLYDKISPTLLWTNPNPTANFAAQTVSIDLSEYKYVAIVTRSTASTEWFPRTTTIFPVMDNYDGYESGAISATGTRAARFTTVYKNSIVFSETSSDFGSVVNTIPYKIYGIKGNINIDLGIDE